jgi:hypothetical protein
MKKRNDSEDKERMDVIPKEFQRLSKGIMEKLEEDEPELVTPDSIKMIDDLIRQELSRVLGLDLQESQRKKSSRSMSFQDVKNVFRSFLLRQPADRRAAMFKPLANELGYYTWEQFVRKLNTVSQASKGAIK